MSAEEGNKLIAEFMGWSISKSGKTYRPNRSKSSKSSAYRVRDIQYHSSWDWLMPACYRFDNLNLDKRTYEALCDDIDHAVSLYEITLVWETLVGAIQWYKTHFKNIHNETQ